MMINIRTLVAAGTLSLLAACGGKSYVVLLESPDGSTGAVVVKGSQGEQVIDQARHGAALDGARPPAPVAAADIERDFGSAMAARPLLPERFLLYFESGGAQLTADSLALLPRIVDNAAKRPAVDVSIIGHTDTVGSDTVNDALALRRAQTVRSLLIARGLPAESIVAIGRG